MSFELKRKYRIILGMLLVFFAMVSILSVTSYFFTWKEDQSFILAQDLGSFHKIEQPSNLLNQLGASLGHFFVFEGLGIASYILIGFVFFLGFRILLGLKIKQFILNYFSWVVGATLWIAIALGLLFKTQQNLCGGIGYECSTYLEAAIGILGSFLFLGFVVTTIIFLKLRLFSGERRPKLIKPKAPVHNKTIQKHNVNNTHIPTVNEPKEKKIIVEESHEATPKTNYNPRLDLKGFKMPHIGLLNYSKENETISVTKKELEDNKNKIVNTLSHYRIGVSKITATVGPTITLYEIIPEKGVRISKIKNLEDDIALSLSALGIRIIAPMPGKGTIGIEVPNQKPTLVSMRHVLDSEKFNQFTMELPVALGKTISGETFVTDLAKMPHLLMAGATGQGKSVGLNVILTSLLYKKHPAEIKFVLVDPKKVELTLFNKIEHHYLAKLPNEEEAVITDTKKVVATLNSLCVEMDERYELLKKASVKNIIEYNRKFIQRKLNPQKGHRFLPYIVLVIDEFADLIMTAGREVELPVARLAQLARAIGIHLIVATQRPSVNVITGLIKANFPTRIAFRVSSKIDSRTILDTQGADQLIGKGDMLYSQGSDLIRLQCAFIDTYEIEKVAHFIGSQTGYSEAFLLPEYIEESNNEIGLSAPEDRDMLFKEAAEIVITSQQGSTSFLQRKLKLGYNRAGRLIDQLEEAGIVGPAEGSKGRQVLIQDINFLETLD